MSTRRTVVVLFPLLMSAATILAVGGVWLEQEHSTEAIARLTRDHVQAVLALVREAATAGLATHAQGFADLEERLLGEAAILLGADCTGPCLTHAHPWLVVRVVEDDGAALLDVWDAVPESERPVWREWAAEQVDLDLFEPGLDENPYLICAAAREGIRTGIFCADGSPLRERLGELGPGAILRHVEASGVAYVAIQDETGVLAASPSVDVLSSVDEDPFLSQPRSESAPRLRSLTWRGRPVLEGVDAIALPDGTTALLRVGVDATEMEQVLAQRRVRRLRLTVAGAFVLVLACLASWALHRRLVGEERLRGERERFASEEARWRDLGQMAAMTAHEVRNPLATIRMAAQRIDLEHAAETGSAALADLCAVITTETDRLDLVIGDFLTLSRPLSIEPAPTPLLALAEEAAYVLRMRREHDTQAVEVSGDAVLEAPVDRARLLQAVQNLGLNALQAIGPAGRVAIRVRREAGVAVIEVADDGPGLSADEKGRALQTFYTTKSFGTGLGLPLVKRIAEGHGGALELQDEPKGGLCAVLRLPLAGGET